MVEAPSVDIRLGDLAIAPTALSGPIFDGRGRRSPDPARPKSDSRRVPRSPACYTMFHRLSMRAAKAFPSTAGGPVVARSRIWFRRRRHGVR